MYYTVYNITNTINNKIYVGVHKTNVLEDNYMGSGKILKLAIEKYGLENFKKEYLAIFDNAEDMYNMEAQIVNEDFVKDSQTYNLKQGGNGGWDHCLHLQQEKLVKARQILAKQRKNNPEKFEHLKEISSMNLKKAHKEGKIKYDTFTGKTHSEETKKLISEKQKINSKGSGNSQFGSMWIYNLELKQNKKIPKDSEIPNGWIKGRKMGFY